MNLRLGVLLPLLIAQAACVGVRDSRYSPYEPLPEPEEPVSPSATAYPVVPPPVIVPKPAPSPWPRREPAVSPVPERESEVPTVPVPEPERAVLPEPGQEPETSSSPVPESAVPAVPPEHPAGAFTPGAAPPAIMALRRDAEAHIQAGDYDDAAADLERAIRIQPGNGELWHQLAVVRMSQQQPGLAEDLARRSNLLARGNSELIRANWVLIAEACRRKGDFEGAADAEARAGQ